MLETIPSPDSAFGRALKKYAHDAFGAELDFRETRPVGLPFFLADRYGFWAAELMGQPAIFMVMSADAADSLNALEKHREIVRTEIDVPLLILTSPALSAEMRRRLVEKRIAFAVPGTQFYVPEAFFDLRSSGPRDTPPPERLSPTAQMLVLAWLQGHPVDDMSLTRLADEYDTAVMSMSRALDELEALQVSRRHVVGRQRRSKFERGGRDLWEFIEPRLQSPVRKKRAVKGYVPLNEAKAAGESALARYTLLASPPTERRAMAAAQWKHTVRRLKLVEADRFDDDRTEIETWSYDPVPLSQGDLVDRLSLYLTVRDDPDERVQQAARQLLEQMSW